MGELLDRATEGELLDRATEGELLDRATDAMRSALEAHKVETTSAAELVCARAQVRVGRTAMAAAGAGDDRRAAFDEAAHRSLHGRSRPTRFSLSDWDHVRAATFAVLRETRHWTELP